MGSAEEMQGQRGLEPNDIVYGCMLDALVCNGQVDEAVQLFAPGSVEVLGSWESWTGRGMWNVAGLRKRAT